jgi:hypothetical protein
VCAEPNRQNTIHPIAIHARYVLLIGQRAAQTALLPFANAVHDLLPQAWLFAVFNQAYRVHPVVPL